MTEQTNHDNDNIGLPCLPDAEAMACDGKFRGITPAMDKAIDKLHEDGWSLVQLYEQPNAVLPVPAGRFPAGRVYLFSDSTAVVVKLASGTVLASIPMAAALQTLHSVTPDVLAGNTWAAARWEAVQQESGLAQAWIEERWLDRDGNAWIVRKVDDGHLVTRNGVPVHTVADDLEAEGLELHPVLVEMVADITGPTAVLAAA